MRADSWARPGGGPVSALLPVGELSQVGEVRRAAQGLADQAGLDETERGQLAVVVTEAATNLARHARGGTLIVRLLGAAAEAPDGVELLTVDVGPGIADLARALADGHSTAGSAGQGLGAMRRMSDEFDMQSLPGVGTVLVARKWSRTGRARRQAVADEHGVVCRPIDGETACGDAWAIARHGPRTTVLLADGLGHGPDAAAAADAAVRIFDQASGEAPAAIVQRCHGALRATRGAALAVATVDWAARTVAFAGVGNIAASLNVPELAEGRSRSFASMNGIVGHQTRSIREFTEPWLPGGVLVLHSDGLTSRWRLPDYPGLLSRHPALVAGTLWRDFARGRDDVTVFVLRETRGLGARV